MKEFLNFPSLKTLCLIVLTALPFGLAGGPAMNQAHLGPSFALPLIFPPIHVTLEAYISPQYRNHSLIVIIYLLNFKVS